MPQIDLRIYKRKLRDEIKLFRRSLSPSKKAQLDEAIFKKLISTWQYKECDTIFIYASTDIEVDTKRIIEHSLSIGKKVALPRCVKNSRQMVFHYIEDLSQLKKGSFSVLEPDESLPVADNDDGLMIVPALALDNNGYRLGYGGGYYDRYLSKSQRESIGICYYENFRQSLLNGRYDVKLKAILTDRFVRRIR